MALLAIKPVSSVSITDGSRACSLIVSNLIRILKSVLSNAIGLYEAWDVGSLGALWINIICA